MHPTTLAWQVVFVRRKRFWRTKTQLAVCLRKQNPASGIGRKPD